MDPFETKENASSSLPTLQEETLLKRFTKYGTLFHLLMAPFIALFGDWFVGKIDWVGHKLFSMPTINTGDNDFWVVPILGMFLAMALCMARVWKNPTKIDWLQPVMVVHGVTALSFFLYYFIDLGSLSYMLGFMFELVIFLAVSYFWWSNKSLADG